MKVIGVDERLGKVFLTANRTEVAQLMGHTDELDRNAPRIKEGHVVKVDRILGRFADLDRLLKPYEVSQSMALCEKAARHLSDVLELLQRRHNHETK